jgi:hypothetical protein
MLNTIDDTTAHNRQYLNEHASELQEITKNLYAFYSVFVASKFQGDCEAPHIKQLAKKLMDITNGNSEKNRLLCAMPPQHSKSSLVTLAYSVWLIINNPKLRILIVNAEKELSIEFGIAIRQLIHEMGSIFGLTISRVKSSATNLRFELFGELQSGNIRLTGASGSITGHPTDIVIVDDPYKGLIDELTPTALNKKWLWYSTLIEQRVRPVTKLIVLHTRWHSEDIQGKILSDEYQRQKYEVVEFPAIATEKDILGREPGDILWPEYYDFDFYQDKQITMGERQFQAIYQQQPLDLTSEYFHLTNLHWDDTYIEQFNIANCRSYDMAYTSEQEALNKNKNADYTAGCHAEKINENKYIFSDFLYKRLGKKNIQYIQSNAKFDGLQKPILIETGTKGGAAKELFRLWDKDYLPEHKCIQSQPEGSKADRATALANAMYDGKIHIYCPDPVLRKELKLQLESFPLGSAHKDLIDCMAHAYNYLKDKKDNRNRYHTSNKRHGRSRRA